MVSRDWFDWTNFGVGWAGLAITLWAVRQATGAKRAALRAEKGVLRHNAEIDFISLARMAKELHGYVESGSMAEARLRTTDLRSELAIAIKQHTVFLGSRAPALRDKQVDLKLITEGLNRTGSAISNQEKTRLLGIVGAILEMLAGESGALRSSRDSEVERG